MALSPVLAAALAKTLLVREYAGYQVTRALRNELGLEATVGEVEVDALGLQVIARDITLDHPSHGRFVAAGTLYIRPSWFALATGRVDLHDITIERASLFLLVRDGRVINMPEFPDAGSDAEPTLDLPFNFVSILDSQLVVDAKPLAYGRLGRIDIRLDASRSGLLSSELSAWDGYLEHPTGRDVISAVELSALLSAEDLQVELARVATPEVEVAVRDAAFTLPLMETTYGGKVELDVDVAHVASWPHGLELPAMQGQLRVSAQVKGRGDGRPTAEATVELEHGKILAYGLGDMLSLDVKLQREGLSFQGGSTLNRDGGRLGVRGQMGFGEGLPLEAYADLQELSFGALMHELSVSPNAIVDWSLIGNWTLKGTLDPLDLSGPLKMPTRDFRITQDAYHASPKRPILEIGSAMLEGRVAIRPKGLSLEDVDIRLPNSRLHADVLLGFDNRLKVKAQALDLDLKDVTPLIGFQLGGRGGFDVSIDGTFSDPAVGGSMKFDDFAFGTYPFGDLDGSFELTETLMAVRFPKISAKKRDSRYSVSEFIMDFADDRLKIGADMRVGRMTLADFYHVFHWENDERYEGYQGEVNGTARVDYSLGFEGDSDNGTMTASMDLEVPKASVDGYGMRDGHFAGSWKWLDHTKGYRGGELTVERFAMRKGKGTVSLSGGMRPGGLLDAVLVADRIALKDTEGVGERLPGLAGTYGVTASVKGEASRPRVDMDLVTTGLALNGDPLGDGRFYVRLTDKSDPWIRSALHWPKGKPPEDAACGHAREGLARGHWPSDPPLRTADGPLPRLDQPMAFVVCGEALQGKLQLDLMLGRTQMFPVRGRVRVDELAFGRLLPRQRGQAPLRGSASGELRIRGGALMSPQTLIAQLTMETLRAGQLDVELMNNGPVRLSFDRGGFSVQNATFIGPSSQLYVKGSGHIRRGLALTMQGNVDLGLLASLSSTVTNASGNVDLHMKLSGMLDKPSIYGHAALRHANLRFASFPEPIEGINGNIRFSQQRVLFEDFSARVAGGRLAWSGQANLKGGSVGSYRIAVEADHLKLLPKEGISLRVGGHGELLWRNGDKLPALRGTLRLDQLVYSRPIKVGRTLGEMVKKQRASFDNYNPELDLITIDLKVVQTKPLHIKNNLIDAELLLRDNERPFKLVGTDQRYGVLGDMAIKKGTVRFRDATFQIREGDITFDSRTRIDPTFDVRAVTDIRRTGELSQADWHILIHTWGNRDSFQFDLRSDPYLSEDDIALLLTVGMTHSELSQLETGDLTGTAALEALATVTGVEREVHKALPEIDDFHVASAYSNSSNRTEPQLFIGKRVAENVRLSASTGLAESRDVSAGVELQLNEQTSVEAVYNNQNSTSDSQLGDVGVDLKWRLEFD